MNLRLRRWRRRLLITLAALWVQEPTVVPTDDGSMPAPGYGFFWWVQSDRRPPAFFARGKYAQHIYVVPESGLVLVRFGRDAGYQHWPQLLGDLASRLVLPRQGEGHGRRSPQRGRCRSPGPLPASGQRC